MFIDITYARFKALKVTNPLSQIYYFQTSVAPNPNQYQAILGNTDQFFCFIQAAADVTDFETNYLAGGIVVSSITDGVSAINPTIDIRSNVLKTGTLTTTTVTADQVILTYTVTAGKTLYLEYFNVTCTLTVAPTNFNTPVIFGTSSLESPSGTKDMTWRFMGPQPQQHDSTFSEPIPIAAGVVIRAVTTPGITTSLTWIVNFGGYER
jgi:hypothetical protein